jgi:threonine/homoserine/homoserine lactone efflux protein
VPSSTSLLGFIAAALVVLLIPGPGVLYVVARSMSQGQRAGLVSVLGLSTGALVHVAAATAGLSAILLTSATAFGIVKLLGAAYLIFLGLRALVARHNNAAFTTPTPRSLYRLFIQGVVVSVLNPKLAVFFLAFLPQFADPTRGSVSRQVLFLGLLYVALALCTDSAYAMLANRLGTWLRGRGGRVLGGPLPQRASGMVYIGLGVGLALADRK